MNIPSREYERRTPRETFKIINKNNHLYRVIALRDYASLAAFLIAATFTISGDFL